MPYYDYYHLRSKRYTARDDIKRPQYIFQSRGATNESNLHFQGGRHLKTRFDVQKKEYLIL